MADSLRASESGLYCIDQARKKRGWTKTVSQVWWETALTSRATLKRFWQGERIQREAFVRICAAVGEDWRRIAVTEIDAEPSELQGLDLEEAPKPFRFQGRIDELNLLKLFTLEDKSQLVVINGAVGIGKTYLAAQFILNVQEQFQVVVWRSLQYPTSLNALLKDLLQALQYNVPIDVSITPTLLIDALRKMRCLIILDQAELLLQVENSEGEPEQKKTAIAQFLRQVGLLRHQSCLLLTTQERPSSLSQLEQETPQVRSLFLTGLDNVAAQKLLAINELSGQENWEELIRRYGGHPQALVLISSTIRELFGGNVSTFLRDSGTLIIPTPLQELLEKQLRQLLPVEKQVLCQLAVADQALPYSDIQTQISVPRYELPSLLESLKQRALIETLIEESPLGHEVWFSLPLLVRKQLLRMNLCDRCTSH
jgi:NACHT domain